jgi:hypothetical protein
MYLACQAKNDGPFISRTKKGKKEKKRKKEKKKKKEKRKKEKKVSRSNTIMATTLYIRMIGRKAKESEHSSRCSSSS